MKQLFKMLAPYLAVGICWCVFKNGWLAILAYHAQILFWSCHKIRPKGSLPFAHDHNKWLLTALPTICTGPLVYVLLPYMTHTDLGAWLIEYKLTGWALLLMIPYFGIIHPVLEQVHWAPLREKTPAAHFLFAGYHMLVLGSLVTVPWLIFCFTALASASFAWQWIAKKVNSLLPAMLSHILADLGIIVAAYWIASG